jgi:glycosyltransferase involved in cell wall biosynthesis
LLFRRVNPDVVHVCWVDHNANLCVKAKLAPLIVSVWGSDINNHFLPSHDAKARERASETLAAAAVVIVDAAGMERKCAMLAGRSVPAEMLHLGVDTERFRPGYRAEAQAWRQKLGIPENAVVLVSMRALTPIYNHDLILEAFARLTHKVDIPVVLVFKVYNMWVPASDTELRGRVERLGISASVRWLANIEFDALPEIYALADIVVNFPSMDSFPVTFAEAAACQRRVVSCRLPSYSGTFAEEYFEMVEPGDVSELSNALARAVNQVTADRNGTAPSLTKARECVEREFTEAHYSEGLDRVYARVRTMR